MRFLKTWRAVRQSLAAQKADVFAAVVPKPMRVSVLTYVCKDCCASSNVLTAISFGPSSCVPSVVSTQWVLLLVVVVVVVPVTEC